MHHDLRNLLLGHGPCGTLPPVILIQLRHFINLVIDHIQAVLLDIQQLGVGESDLHQVADLFRDNDRCVIIDLIVHGFDQVSIL